MSNNNNNFKKWLVLVITLFITISCSVSKKETIERPNIILIMADDHAVRALGCYGGKYNTTPNIDRIADEGIKFTNSFVSNFICAPSRAVMLTGKNSESVKIPVKKGDASLEAVFVDKIRKKITSVYYLYVSETNP